MNKEDSKLFILKDTFVQGHCLSIKDMCSLLDINRSRAYDYLNILKDEGIDLITKKDGRHTIYYLANEMPDEAYYEPLTDKDILRFRILNQLSHQSMTARDLCKHLSGIDSDIDNIPKTSTYYKEINEMIDEDMLDLKTQRKSTAMAYSDTHPTERLVLPTGKGYSLLLPVDVEGQDMMNAMVASGQAHGSALRNLHRKIAIITGNNTDYEFDDSIFIQYGRSYHMDSNISECLINLLENHFRDKVLTFNYRGKSTSFETGMVVYSQDKDMLYLMGHKKGTHGSIILKYSDISNLSHTDEENKEYGKDQYNTLLQDMFSISLDPPEEIEIHFKKTGINQYRLEKLRQLRTRARITEQKDNLIYKDVISGISDFANYLRGYGFEFTIISPVSLQTSINITKERLRSRYQDV